MYRLLFRGAGSERVCWGAREALSWWTCEGATSALETEHAHLWRQGLLRRRHAH